jgi:hypothetical protein
MISEFLGVQWASAAGSEIVQGAFRQAIELISAMRESGIPLCLVIGVDQLQEPFCYLVLLFGRERSRGLVDGLFEALCRVSRLPQPDPCQSRANGVTFRNTPPGSGCSARMLLNE